MTDNPEAMLRDIDASIDSLASQGDVDALGRLLAEDFRYNHSTGLDVVWTDGRQAHDRAPGRN